MNIGVLGTGVVGETLATALTKRGHNVRLGSRTADNEKAAQWVKAANDHATQGTFDDAAAFGEIVFFCLNGGHALDAVKRIDAESVRGKIFIDLTNPLDFSKGMPPTILQDYRAVSLGEQIQDALPGALVVKTLNTINCNVMVNPGDVNKGEHTLFICGNHRDAKNKVMHFLVDNFGWKPDSFLDLGDLANARLTEAYVPFWVTLMQTLGTPMFSIKVVK